MSTRESKLAYLSFAAICIIWGTTYLAIKVALETVPPFLIGGIRYSLAGALLVALTMARGEVFPPRNTWGSFALRAFLLLVVGNGGVLVAEQWVPSGLAALVTASTPFWMIGVEAMIPDGERPTLRGIMGLVLGFIGITILVWPELFEGSGRGTAFLAGIAMLQIASVGWALGTSYTKRLRTDSSPAMSAAVVMLFAGVMMSIVGIALGEPSRTSFTGVTILALAHLTLLGAVLAFVAYMYALRVLPVSIVSLYPYVNPVVALLLGSIVLDEVITFRVIIAALVIAIGMATVMSQARGRDMENDTDARERVSTRAEKAA